MNRSLTTPIVEEQIVAFADLSGYHRQICSKLSPEETFGFLSEYYATVQAALDGSAARIVKFFGDTILIVFPSRDPDDALDALQKLTTSIDAFLSAGHYDSRLRVKAHVGMVASGPVGVGELETVDVCGVTVNQTALLPNGEWVLSEDLQKRIKA
jgi:class 3 adenylate cyclase